MAPDSLFSDRLPPELLMSKEILRLRDKVNAYEGKFNHKLGIE
jgi:hypothetical protein